MKKGLLVLSASLLLVSQSEAQSEASNQPVQEIYLRCVYQGDKQKALTVPLTQQNSQTKAYSAIRTFSRITSDKDVILRSGQVGPDGHPETIQISVDGGKYFEQMDVPRNRTRMTLSRTASNGSLPWEKKFSSCSIASNMSQSAIESLNAAILGLTKLKNGLNFQAPSPVDAGDRQDLVAPERSKRVGGTLAGVKTPHSLRPEEHQKLLPSEVHTRIDQPAGSTKSPTENGAN